MSRLATVSTGWNPSNSNTPALPEPTNLAVNDSFFDPPELIATIFVKCLDMRDKSLDVYIE